MTCPRCGGLLDRALYGPCVACAAALRAWADGAGAHARALSARFLADRVRAGDRYDDFPRSFVA